MKINLTQVVLYKLRRMLIWHVMAQLWQTPPTANPAAYFVMIA